MHLIERERHDRFPILDQLGRERDCGATDDSLGLKQPLTGSLYTLLEHLSGCSGNWKQVSFGSAISLNGYTTSSHLRISYRDSEWLGPCRCSNTGRGRCRETRL